MMDDTSAQVRQQYENMIMMRSFEERLLMGCSMFDTAKEIVKSSILEKNSHLTEAEVKREIFLRFYGDDFNEIQKQKILNNIK